MRWHFPRLRGRNNTESDNTRLQKGKFAVGENTSVNLLPDLENTEQPSDVQYNDPIARDFGPYRHRTRGPTTPPQRSPGEDPVWDDGQAISMSRHVPSQRVGPGRILSYEPSYQASVSAPGTQHISMNLDGRYPMALDGTLKHSSIPEHSLVPGEIYETASVGHNGGDNASGELEPPPETQVQQPDGNEAATGNVAGKGSRSAFNPYYAPFHPEAANGIPGPTTSTLNRQQSSHDAAMSNYPIDRTLSTRASTTGHTHQSLSMPNSRRTSRHSLAVPPAVNTMSANDNFQANDYPPLPPSPASSHYSYGRPESITGANIRPPPGQLSPIVDSPGGSSSNMMRQLPALPTSSNVRHSIPSAMAPQLPPRPQTVAAGSYTPWQNPANVNSAAPSRSQSAYIPSTQQYGNNQAHQNGPVHTPGQQPVFIQHRAPGNNRNAAYRNSTGGLSTGLHPFGQMFIGKAERAIGSFLSSESIKQSGIEKEREVDEFKRANRKSLLSRFGSGRAQRNSVHGYPSQGMRG